MKILKLFLSIALLLLMGCYHDRSGAVREAARQNLYPSVPATPAVKAATQSPKPISTGDRYEENVESDFIHTQNQPISTFAIDADGASYANARRYLLDEERFPPKGAVRTEEFLNYFQFGYDYSDPSLPIQLNGEISACPWNEEARLVRIGIQGRPIAKEDLPGSNFVFLIDVSGSMATRDKLEMLKSGFKSFVDQLSAKDRVAIVTYAGRAGVVLESTAGDEKVKIKRAINRLGAGGSTAGAAGIVTAYEIAEANFIPGGNNRIVVGTDGDFNVGASSQEELVRLIEEKRASGVFVTVLGVGRGNLNDAMLEQIANNGNGTYEYLDKLDQLKKVFVYEYNKFFAVAKDVKIQVQFHPEQVASYRLVGYENRLLNTEDFEDDQKDAGEIGAGQNVTALYEIIPAVNGQQGAPSFTVDFRYKAPSATTSTSMQLEITDEGRSFAAASDQMKFASSVALFSLLLRDSKHVGSTSYTDILEWLEQVHLRDEYHLKSEFRSMVAVANSLANEL